MIATLAGPPLSLEQTVQLTIDTSQPLEDVLRVLGAMYNVAITVEPAPESVAAAAPARASTRRTATRRRPGRTPIRSHGKASRSGATSAEIRAWAVANGFDVGSKGRIPRAVVDAFGAKRR